MIDITQLKFTKKNIELTNRYWYAYEEFMENPNTFSREQVRLTAQEVILVKAKETFINKKILCQFPFDGCAGWFNQTLNNHMINGATCSECGTKYSILIREYKGFTETEPISVLEIDTPHMRLK